MKRKTRIGIFGGTFNPPHNGHIKAAETFLKQLELDRLLIIPTCTPHKVYTEYVLPEVRLEMCNLAFSILDNTEISEMEIKRGGRGYTYETLQELKSDSVELYLLCGTDMFLMLDKWQEPMIIFDLATICLVRRESEEENNVEIQKKISEYKEKFGARICIIDSVAVELSSTFVRNIFSSGCSAAEYIPKNVVEFINERGLYKK